MCYSGSMKQDNHCNHKFEFLRTSKYTESYGYNIRFIRNDVFYCTECLEYKTINKEAYARDTPDWYKGD